jgi:hypothetical protein
MSTRISNLLTGCILVGFKKGHGSFFEILLVGNDGTRFAVWVYLCDWAMVDGDVELLSSDIVGAGMLVDLTEHLRAKVEEVHFFDENHECHISLSSGLRLEMWNNPLAYPANGEMFNVFREGTYLLSYPRDGDQ